MVTSNNQPRATVANCVDNTKRQLRLQQLTVTVADSDDNFTNYLG